ncbi:MAG: radical SAM protein [Candidatus Thorarchaeota archaeon]
MNENNEEIRYAIKDEKGDYLTPFPVDPIALSEMTRRIVCKTSDGVPLRKYTRFYAVGVYGGIVTAYSVGCNYRCTFCWVDWSRDWPEKYGEFYSPSVVYGELRQIMKVQALRRARISGAEPTLCPEHILGVLEHVHRDREEFDLFVIESNGVVLSQDQDLVENLSRYASTDTNTVGHVRLSIRGGLPEPFEEKTGCQGKFVELPFIAAQHLWDANISFHVAVVVDPRFTTEEEKQVIYDKLSDIDRTVRENVEEEYLDPYPHALVRLRAVGRADVTGKEVSRVEESILRERPEKI